MKHCQSYLVGISARHGRFQHSASTKYLGLKPKSAFSHNITRICKGSIGGCGRSIGISVAGQVSDKGMSELVEPRDRGNETEGLPTVVLRLNLLIVRAWDGGLGRIPWSQEFCIILDHTSH